MLELEDRLGLHWVTLAGHRCCRTGAPRMAGTGPGRADGSRLAAREVDEALAAVGPEADAARTHIPDVGASAQARPPDTESGL